CVCFDISGIVRPYYVEFDLTDSGNVGQTMRIAFVNQPTDTIIPPNQNSVGACTYWVARPLAQSAQVLVFGLTDNHGNPNYLKDCSGIDFRFFRATPMDKLLFSVQKKIARLFPRSTP